MDHTKSSSGGRRARTGADALDPTVEHQEVAEQVTLQRIDEAGAVTRPTHLGATYVEQEYDQLFVEQAALWEASGHKAARKAQNAADSLAVSADAGRRALQSHAAILHGAACRFNDTLEALGPLRRRQPGGKPIHYLAKSALLVGDMVGITVIGINIGDYPLLAGLLAISAASSAVIAGLVGAEIRDIRATRRRTRSLDALTTKQRPYQHLFTTDDEGIRLVKIVCLVAAFAAATIALGIFAGRSALDDPLVGVVYGGFAAAVAAASFVESYMHADEVADQIDNVEHDYRRELARHAELASALGIRERAEFESEADSIYKEFEARARAAGSRMKALKWGILRRNPGVVGHGPSTAPGPIGRTTRQGGVQ